MQRIVRSPGSAPAPVLVLVAVLVLAVLAVAPPAAAHEPEFTLDAGRDGCTFTTSGDNPYYPLWPGQSSLLEGEDEDDEGMPVEISVLITVTGDTQVIDGVPTRVVTEEESEDGEIVEISHNYIAVCRETGAVWYFGEDVDIYEDGEVVAHDGAWRAGEDGAQAGILMPGTPLVGARFHQEYAPGVAEDRSEIVGRGEEVTVPAGTFTDTVETEDTTPLAPEDLDEKAYAAGVGLIVDAAAELVDFTPPPCVPDAHTLCLQDGRFRVEAEWTDFDLNEGMASVNPVSDDSGELWFFRPDNVELLVKVLDGCDQFGHYWVFAAGLTNVGVSLTVTDTATDETYDIENMLGDDFEPVLDTTAFDTCP